MITLSFMRPVLLSLSIAPLFVACSSDNNSPPPPAAKFQIKLTNLTAGQPMSPLVAIAHDSGFSLLSMGQPASVALEHLAEGGETAHLITLATASTSYLNSAVGSAAIPPGGSSTVNLTFDPSKLANAKLSVASMLVNTNDAFTGVNAQSLSGLAVGASLTLNTLSMDAGTESNTESAATIPGPVGGGEGFNSARSDIRDAVHLHAGVITAADGLSTSVLTQKERWDNPVGSLTITRMQ